MNPTRPIGSGLPGRVAFSHRIQMHGITTGIELGALLLIGDGLMGAHQASLALASVAFWAGACEFKYLVARSG